MGFLSQFEGKLAQESELSVLKRDRDEARQLASRLHVDLDRMSAEADNAKQAAFAANKAAKAAQQDAKIAKLALLHSRNQNEAMREELIRSQQCAADRTQVAIDLQSSLAETKTGLARAQQEIDQFKQDRANEPISDLDLLFHYKRLRTVIESLTATLSCALCFEPFAKDEVMTFQCGHTYCATCVQHWAVRSAINRFEATKGRDMKPECPECRADGSKHSRVKVYMLEEAVRVLQRLEQSDLRALPPDREASVTEVDEEAAAILRPRAPMRYGGSDA